MDKAEFVFHIFFLKKMASPSSRFRSPIIPQRFQLLTKRDLVRFNAAPTRPHPISPQKAVLILRQPRQRHEQDPLLGPTGFGGEGEYLGC
jgi:hypothetical protein